MFTGIIQATAEVVDIEAGTAFGGRLLLGNDADPRDLVPAGNTFNAVISIESPAAEATGFKLNVCYRLAGGQLRCAIEDFK